MKRLVVRAPRARRVSKILLLAAALSGAFPRPSGAQATGQIMGNVFDQGGNPLSGVTVTVRSATDIAPRTVRTDADGFFRILGLMPGTFELRASAADLHTLVRQGIKVGVGASPPETLFMEVATAATVIDVPVPRSPVDTSSGQTRITFERETLENTPWANRSDVQGVLADGVPGTIGDSSSPQFRGATGTQTANRLEGFDVNGVNGRPGPTVSLNSIAALEIGTGNQGPGNAAAAGAVVNAVTLSGSNTFQAELEGFHENSRAQFFKDNLDPKAFNMQSQLSLSVLGPVVRDRLWFFANLEGRNAVAATPRDVLGLRPTPPRFSRNTLRSNGKLTLQLNPHNKLQGIWLLQREAAKNGQRGYDYDADAQSKNDSWHTLLGVIWESVLTDALILRSQVGWQSTQSDVGPESCRTDPVNCDHVPGLRQREPFLEYQNFTFHEIQKAQTLEWINTLEGFFNHRVVGEHNLKLIARWKGSRLERRQSTPGDAVYVFDGVTPYSKRTLYVNDPSVEDGRFGWAITTSTARILQFSLEDQWKPPGGNHLTVTPGVGVISTSALDGNGNPVIAFTTATPHIAVVWDPTHDGRTAVRAGFNQYLDAGNLAVANFASESRTIKICEYDDVSRTFSRNCRFEGGARGRTVGLPCGTDGFDADGKRCTTRLGIPRTWEYTAGAEREIAEGVALASDFQYRRYDNPYEDLETNQQWNPTGTGLDPTGAYKNGQARAVLDLETPSDAHRRYLGVVTSVKKREGKFKANLSYQWARLEGNVINGFQNPYGNNPAQDLYQYGFLPGDSRHTIRSQASYQLNPSVSAGATFNYTSGTPQSPLYFNEVTQSYADLRAQRGFHPGLLLNDPGDDFAWRLPDRQDLNLQVRANLKALTGVNAELYADILNLLALRTVTAVRVNQDGPAAGTPVARLEPFRIRLGFRLKY